MARYDLEFVALPEHLTPDIPYARGNQESPIRTAIKELQRGRFIFVIGNDRATRKRVSDMVSRTRRESDGVKAFAIRGFEMDGKAGLGVWRTDDFADLAHKVVAKVFHDQAQEVPWPTKEQMMAGK